MSEVKRGSPAAAIESEDQDSERSNELVAQIGAEIAMPLSAALERISALTATGRIDRDGLRALRDEVEQARRIGMIGQQLSRFASGRVRQSPEQVQLGDALSGVLAHRSRETQARGVALKPTLKAVSVTVDASLLFSLLNTTIDWALPNAQSCIEFRIDLTARPIRARITCRFAHRETEVPRKGGGPDVPPGLDALAWRLLEQTAWTLGLRIARKDERGTTSLVLEFPHTVQVGQSPVAATLVDDEASSTNSKALAGSHVLVISSRRELRDEIRAALRNMHLLIDFVGSIPEAAGFCREGLPHAIIVEQNQLGERYAEFRDDILAEVPGFAFVEIVAEGSTFEMSGLNGAAEARVGRQVIANSLPAALMYELSKGL